MGLPDSSFIRCLLHMEKHFVLVTGILTVSVFHYSIANEFVSLMLAWCLTDHLRELLLRRLAVSGERYCSAVCNTVVCPGHPSGCKVNVSFGAMLKSGSVNIKLQCYFTVMSLQLPVA